MVDGGECKIGDDLPKFKIINNYKWRDYSSTPLNSQSAGRPSPSKVS